MSADFGTKVAQLRKERDMSRDELGEKVGTSGAIVGRYERGDMKPSIEIAAKIAEALDVSLDFLMGLSSELVKDKKMVNRLEDIKKLPDTERNKIFDYIDLIIRDTKIKRAHAA
ncbi:MAG: helix-turn-helix domain-containing protein [Flammeovirgaceae bacterium]